MAFFAIASAASASFQSRALDGVFGPPGSGSCADEAIATGTGDIDAARGTGDYVVLASGSGRLTTGSDVISEVNTDTGAFAVGESIHAPSIPDNTTITAVGVDTLTISSAATTNATRNLISTADTIESVVTSIGAFAVGMEMATSGFPSGTTVTAVGADTLTLSASPSTEGTGVTLVAGSTEVTSVSQDCGAFAVGQTILGEGISSTTSPTKIASVGPGTLTLSRPPTAPGSGIELSTYLAFDRNEHVAVDQVNDRLYVVDESLPGFHGFDTSTPGSSVPLAAPFPISAGLDRAFGVAVDNTSLASAGRVYFAACTQLSANNACVNSKIFAFAPDGTELNASTGHPGFPAQLPFAGGFQSGLFGQLEVDPDGNIWIGNSQFRVYRFAPTGVELSPVFVGDVTTGVSDIAFDSDGNLYFAAGTKGVYRYRAADNYQPPPGGATAISGQASAITVDRSTNTLYVARSGSGANGYVYVYDGAGALLYSFGYPGSSGFSGIAVDEATDTVYVSHAGFGVLDNRVAAFAPPGTFSDPAATMAAASDVSVTQAGLSGTVEDNGALPTEWRFQLSSDGGATWFDARQGTPVIAGSTAGGETGASVSGTATGLQSDAEYMARIALNKNPKEPEVYSNTVSFATDPIPDAIATPDTPTNVTATGAELSATIDDNGFLPTNWKLQTSVDGEAWATAVEGTTEGGQLATAVSGPTGELEPNTLHHFRVVTDKGPGSNGEIPTAGPDFTTETAPPIVSDATAYAISDTSARLVGQVDPSSEQTVYRFSYGTSPGALDSMVPATPAPAGDGPDPVPVSEPIAGLDPDTEYFFQLTATNGTGSDESAVESFRTRVLPLPNPDDRGYEQVSPVDKNGGALGVMRGEGGVIAAWDGNAAGFVSPTPFEGAQIKLVLGTHLSSRGAGGWHSRWTNSRYCGYDFESESGVNSVAAPDPLGGAWLSPQLDHGAIQHPESTSCSTPPLDPSAPLPQKNLYRADYETGAYRLLAPAASAGGAGGNGTPSATFAAASDDYSRIVYTSTGRQTFDAPVGDFAKVYGWDEGALSLISRDTSNAPLTSAASVPIDALNGVSADGSHVFFQNPTSGSDEELYLRTGGATHWVSEQECSPACSNADGADVFEWASLDGEKAFFLSTAQRTSEDTSTGGSDLYRYVHSADPANDQNLTLLSKDSEPADGDSAGVLGMLGTSEDGDTVYFAASGQLVAGQPTDTGPKLYRWQAGGSGATLAYLATLDPTSGGSANDVNNWNWLSPSSTNRPDARAVNPSGEHLLIHTVKSLRPALDRDADADVYRWGEGEGWRCLSCQAPGTPSAGDSSFKWQGGTQHRYLSAELRTVMSDDGQRVYFNSPDALVPADTNGVDGCPVAFTDDNAGNPSTPIGYRCQDVYEWHDGALNLISTGLGTAPVYLGAVGRSGRDVFFTTPERLVGWDTDNATDLYDARIGGGFPEPEPEGAPCEGEGCRDEGTESPASAGAGSAVFEGPGNPAAGPPGAKRRGCAKSARRAQRQARLAKRMRRRARRVGNPRQVRQMRKRANRLTGAARKNRNRAKRCRRSARRAGADRRAAR